MFSICPLFESKEFSFYYFHTEFCFGVLLDNISQKKAIAIKIYWSPIWRIFTLRLGKQFCKEKF